MSHQNDFQTIVAGITVIKNAEGKFLFMRRSSAESYAAGKWDFPGGAKEFLESVEEGALRECKEEAGIDVQIEKLLWYRVNQGATDKNTEFVAFYFLCSPLSEDVQLSHEHDDYRWLTLEEAKELECIPWMQDFYEQIETKQISLD